MPILISVFASQELDWLIPCSQSLSTSAVASYHHLCGQKLDSSLYLQLFYTHICNLLETLPQNFWLGCFNVVEFPGLLYLQNPNSFSWNLSRCISTFAFLLHISALRRYRNGWGKNHWNVSSNFCLVNKAGETAFLWSWSLKMKTLVFTWVGYLKPNHSVYFCHVELDGIF